MSARRAIGTALLALVASILALPSPLTAADGAIRPITACEVLDANEVGRALGTSIEDGQDIEGLVVDDGGWLTQCHFWRDPDLFLTALELTVASGPGYRETFEEMRFEPGASVLEGIADDAVLRLTPMWGFDQPVGSLSVRRGDLVLELALGIIDVRDDGTLVQVGDGERQREVLVDLAGTAVGRIAEPVAEPRVEATDTCGLLSVAEAAELTGQPLVRAVEVPRNDVEDGGPGCQYLLDDKRGPLFVGVDRDTAAIDRFEACEPDSEPVNGLGDAAFIASDDTDCGYVKIGYVLITDPLLVRSGDTVVTVAAVTGELGQGNPSGSPDVEVAIARRVLEALGAGATLRSTGTS